MTRARKKSRKKATRKTGASKKSPRKATRKAGASKKKTRKSRKAGASRSASVGDDGGFVILLDEPDESAEDPTPGAPAVVRLRSDCTIGEISGMHQRLLKALEGGEALSIDLGAVEGVDTAFLQLLCALALEADRKNVELTWQNQPESFMKSAALLGIEDRFPRA